jgi:hypothetical protein
MNTFTGAIYSVSASILAAWLVLHDVPIVPVVCGICMVGSMMIRLGERC